MNFTGADLEKLQKEVHSRRTGSIESRFKDKLTTIENHISHLSVLLKEEMATRDELKANLLDGSFEDWYNKSVEYNGEAIGRSQLR